MKIWLVVLLLYPDNRYMEKRIGPYVDQPQCMRAVTGTVIRPRPGGPRMSVYCDDGCGLERNGHLQQLFAQREEAP